MAISWRTKKPEMEWRKRMEPITRGDVFQAIEQCVTRKGWKCPICGVASPSWGCICHWADLLNGLREHSREELSRQVGGIE